MKVNVIKKNFLISLLILPNIKMKDFKILHFNMLHF